MTTPDPPPRNSLPGCPAELLPRPLFGTEGREELARQLAEAREELVRLRRWSRHDREAAVRAEQEAAKLRVRVVELEGERLSRPGSAWEAA